MKHIETFFWGTIVALTALFFEVFLNIILNDFFHFTFFSFNYQELNLIFALISILIIATIEESLKFTILLKRTWLFTENYKDLFLNGFLFGFGFFTFEIISSYYKGNLFQIPIWQLISVLLTHTILGILALLGIAKITKKYIILILALNIVLHSIANILILIFSR